MDYSNPAILIIAGIYYAITGILTFFSLFAVYILLRYGRSPMVSLVVAVFYGIIFLGLLQQSYITLHTIGS